MLKTSELFFAKVHKTDTCWLWTGALNTGGYGTVMSQGTQLLSHRFSWMYINGRIPSGILVCHHCDVRSCVNPEHLFLGTQQDNMQDMVNKGRHIGKRKLQEWEVLGIRWMCSLSSSVIKKQDIADMFEIDRKTVYNIDKNIYWSNL